MSALSEAAEIAPSLHLTNTRSIGTQYATTLVHWRERFVKHSHTLSKLNYSDRFQRMFKWYFVYCESAFQYGLIDLKQLTYEKTTDAVKEGIAKDGAIVYHGPVVHIRHDGVPRSFKYPMSMLFADVARLDKTLQGVRWMSAERRNLLSLRRRDYAGNPNQSLDESICADIYREHGEVVDGPIYLLTTPKALGYAFNPLSVFYVFSDRNCERVEYLVLEVTNTPWLECIRYVVKPKVDKEGRLRARFAKDMHVSPFLGMDYVYDLKATVPTESKVSLTLKLLPAREEKKQTPSDKSLDQVQPHFVATFNLSREGTFHPQHPTDTISWPVFFQLLFMPWLMQLWIHYQAVILVLRRQKIFYVRHPEYDRNKAWGRVMYAWDLVRHMVIFVVAMAATAGFWLLGVKMHVPSERERNGGMATVR